MVGLGDGVVARVARDNLVARIERRTVRAVVLPVFGGDRHLARADLQPPGSAGVEELAVREVDVVAFDAAQPVRRAACSR